MNNKRYFVFEDTDDVGTTTFILVKDGESIMHTSNPDTFEVLENVGALLNKYDDEVIILQGKLKEKEKECNELNLYATACDDAILELETEKYHIIKLFEEYLKNHEVKEGDFLYEIGVELGLEL